MNRQAVDRQRRLEIVLQTGNRGRKLAGETGAHAMNLGTRRLEVRGIADRAHLGHGSGATSSGIFERRLAMRWNQHRMRIEEEKTDSIALISPGAQLS